MRWSDSGSGIEHDRGIERLHANSYSAMQSNRRSEYDGDGDTRDLLLIHPSEFCSDLGVDVQGNLFDLHGGRHVYARIRGSASSDWGHCGCNYLFHERWDEHFGQRHDDDEHKQYHDPYRGIGKQRD